MIKTKPSKNNNKISKGNETDTPSKIDDQPARVPKAKIAKRGSSRYKSKIIFTMLALALAILTLAITLGQYYQSGYSTRISITTLWREGYTDDIRNRVTKYSYHYKIWENDAKGAEHSLDILTDDGAIFDANNIRNDPNLMNLIAADLEEKKRGLNGGEINDSDYIEATQKYRNALLDCLNTMEAVKAVIQARPPWIKRIFGNPESLEERYKDLITERTKELRPFIERYRYHHHRPTPPWIILTENMEGDSY